MGRPGDGESTRRAMARGGRRLAIATFPTPFSGEAAVFELGLHRVETMAAGRWETVWVELVPGDPSASVAAILAQRPLLAVLHVHRTQVLDGLAFANALGAEAPRLPLILCGWPAHAPYVDAVAAAGPGLVSPNFALACGEVEAIVPQILDAFEQGEPDVERLVGLPGVCVWDRRGRAWRGDGRFAVVPDLGGLPPASVRNLRKEWDGRPADWLDLSRGCIYRCAFCLACSFPRARLRRHAEANIRAGARAAAERGVRVLGLLSSSNSFDVGLLRDTVRALREVGPADVLVAGPVHARFAVGETLELLGSLRWDLMTIGLQTITPAAQRAMRRRDDPEEFARAMERIASFTAPEVEIILGLPGDTPEGFRRTVTFLLSLPVKITVHTLRLDPWSTFLVEREALGIEADFAQVARVSRSRGFADGQIEECRAWLRGLGPGPWPHRAKRLALDGDQVV